MKRALIPALLLTLCLFLCGCGEDAPPSAEEEQQRLVEAALSVNDLGNVKKLRKSHDISSCLVGEFNVSNGDSASFDSRGSVKLTAPNKKSMAGFFYLTEKGDESVVLMINFGSGEEEYAFEQLTEDGSFSLTDRNNTELIFEPKRK